MRETVDKDSGGADGGEYLCCREESVAYMSKGGSMMVKV